MSTPIWLTDEDSEVPGYLRAKVPFLLNQSNRSDCPSLVRQVTNSAAGPATIPVVRKKAGATISGGWLTDPLSGPNLTNGSWVFHIWANADTPSANIGLQITVSTFTGTSVVSASMSSALGATTSDVALPSGAANPTSMANGDRLLITIALVDAGGTMVANHNATVSYNGLYARTEGDTYVLCPDNIGLVGTQPGAEEIIGDIPDDDVLAVRTILRDASSQIGLSNNPILSDEEVVRYIIQAVATYGIDRPFIAPYLYTGDGTTFDFPLPPKWIWSVSRITAIEYPAAQQIPNTLEYLDWEIREDILGTQPVRKLRMRTIIPDQTIGGLYITYTTRHTYSTEVSTVPREDQDAIMWLAASYAAQAISAKFAGATDSSLAADSINYRDSQVKWSNVADRLKDMYLNRVVNPDMATPNGTTQEWRPVLESGQAMLWHSRRVRRVFY